MSEWYGKDKSERKDKRQTKGKPGSKPRPKRPKEVEENVDLKSINKEDLPHIKTSTKGNNDPQWYKNVPGLSDTVSNLWMSRRLGSIEDPFKGVNPKALTANAYTYTNAGIMRIGITPTVGYSNDPSSAVNLAAQKLYSKVRAANSGAKNYDKTDMMMVVLAMDSAYMLYEVCVRLYKVLNSYDLAPVNRYIPDQLTLACNGSTELRAHLADFRAFLDLFAYKLSSICVPDCFDIIKRHSWLFSNVYTDASTSKNQMYVLAPHGLYIWNEVTDEGAQLQYKTMPTITGNTDGLFTSVTSMMNAMDMLMDPLLGSEDVGEISGDLQKAFGQGGLITVATIDKDAILNPVYNREVLMQISNLNQAAMNWTNSSFNIVQNKDNLQSGPFLVTTPTLSSNQYDPLPYVKPILNFIDMDPTPDDILVATRLMTECAAIAGSGNSITVQESIFGTEVPRGIRVYTAMASSPTAISPTFSTFSLDGNALIVNMQQVGATQANFNQICQWSQFDWAPALHLSLVNTTESAYLYQGAVVDLCNYMYMPFSTLKWLHENCIMSLLYPKF